MTQSISSAAVWSGRPVYLTFSFGEAKFCNILRVVEPVFASRVARTLAPGKADEA